MHISGSQPMRNFLRGEFGLFKGEFGFKKFRHFVEGFLSS